MAVAIYESRNDDLIFQPKNGFCGWVWRTNVLNDAIIVNGQAKICNELIVQEQCVWLDVQHALEGYPNCV